MTKEEISRRKRTALGIMNKLEFLVDVTKKHQFTVCVAEGRLILTDGTSNKMNEALAEYFR